jgi:allantoate deiminase
MGEAGLEVYEDAVGSLFGRREGRRSEVPVLLVGSYLDSVYNGGNFDGPLGVLAGIEVRPLVQVRPAYARDPTRSTTRRSYTTPQ